MAAAAAIDPGPARRELRNILRTAASGTRWHRVGQAKPVEGPISHEPEVSLPPTPE
jgi:hypothetical protein